MVPDIRNQLYLHAILYFLWQGLADFYDKQKPTVAQDMVDAVVAYKKLLQYLDT